MLSRAAVIKLALCLFVIAALSLMVLPACAEETFSEQIEALLAELNTDELQEYINELREASAIDVKDKILELTTGDLHIDAESFGEFLFRLVFSEVSALLPVFATIAAILLLYGVLNQIKSATADPMTSHMIHTACYVAIVVLLLICVTDVTKETTEAVHAMKRQMDLLFPILLTMMAASGGSVSVGIYRPAVAFLSNGITSIISDIVFPSAAILLVLSLVGNLSSEINVRGFRGLFQGFNRWILGISLTVFSIFLTVQGITSAQYDGISLKAAKYAIGNSVPIVGGFLSGGFDLAVAGSSLLKNSFGVFSVFLLFFVSISPICALAAIDLLLKFAASLSDFAETSLTSVFRETAESLHYYLAGLLCVAFLYFLTVLLLVCSCTVL